MRKNTAGECGTLEWLSGNTRIMYSWTLARLIANQGDAPHTYPGY